MARILIVEDDAHILRVISMWIKRQGHEVMEAANGRDALELLTAHGADVMVTDVNMPVMDGLELLEQATAAGVRPAGVVVLTNRWDHQQIGEQIEAQGVRVIPKPFSPNSLAGVISEMAAAAATET